MIIIENKTHQAAIHLQAGELHHLIDKQTGVDYIHDGNPKHWSGRNPTLFPKVGKSYQNTQLIHGKQYAMGNHGFARYGLFTLVSQTDCKVVLELRSNEETLAQYPFAFRMRKSYELQGSKMVIRHEIYNDGDEMMPFTIGHHPAFRCPLLPEESMSEYAIAFDQMEKMEVCNYDADGFLLEGYTAIESEQSKSLQLPFERYGIDSLTFDQLSSSSVSMTGPKHGVRVNCIGHPVVTLWPKDDRTFLCIEPWLSTSDDAGYSGAFQDKKGMIWLEPGRCFVNTYEFEVF